MMQDRGYQLCVHVSYSLLKIPLDVVIVNTDSDGFLDREELRVDAVFDQTLRDSLRAATPMLNKSTEHGGTAEMICYEGNSKVYNGYSYAVVNAL